MTREPVENPDSARVSTGIPGLDEITSGGFPANRLYLVQGQPGTGKTTLTFQFLLEGVARGDRVVYITLSESEEELREIALSHGWSLEGIDLIDLPEEIAADDTTSQNTLFYPSEVELGETIGRILGEIERIRPKRVVFDSLSELRLLAQTALRFRRQILALKQRLNAIGATVLVVEDTSLETEDLQLESLAHGVIALTQTSPIYGADRRRLRVAKLRGSGFLGGHHDFRIEKGGLRIYPRLVAVDFPRLQSPEKISSGSEAIDAILGGGLDYGTSTLFLGPAGTGKSALAAMYGYRSAMNGQRVKFFLFEEGLGTFFGRARALGMDLLPLVESGAVSVQHIDPAELLPGEFVDLVRDAVENDAARMVVVDSVTGYLNAMLDENYLLPQLHELLNYLRRRGIVIVLVMAQHGLVGTHMASNVDISYLADTVVLLRHYESHGKLSKAISVVKKRSGPHESTIRQLRLGDGGITAGGPLTTFQGLLTGVPTFTGERPRDRDDDASRS